MYSLDDLPADSTLSAPRHGACAWQQQSSRVLLNCSTVSNEQQLRSQAQLTGRCLGSRTCPQAAPMGNRLGCINELVMH